MSGRKPYKYKWENEPDQFRRAFIWYLDVGMSAPSRRQALDTLEKLIPYKRRAMERWISGKKRPKMWEWILSHLENEYGQVPNLETLSNFR